MSKFFYIHSFIYFVAYYGRPIYMTRKQKCQCRENVVVVSYLDNLLHITHIYINILENIDDDVWKTQTRTTITVKQDYWPRYCRISNIFQTFLFLKFYMIWWYDDMMMMMLIIIIISNCVSLSHKSDQLFPSHILIDITTYATGFNKSTYSSFLLLFFRKHHWICFQYSRVINKIFFSWIISHGFSIWNVKCKEFKFNLSGK